MARKPLDEGRPDTSFEGYDRPSRSGIVSSLRARRDQATAASRKVSPPACLSTPCHPAMIGMRGRVQNEGSAMLRPSVPGGLGSYTGYAGGAGSKQKPGGREVWVLLLHGNSSDE